MRYEDKYYVPNGGAVAAMKEAREALGVSSKGLARPQLAGSRVLSAPAAAPSSGGPADVWKTLEDVTPADVAKKSPRTAETEPMAKPAPTAATVPVVAGMSAGRKLAVALGILAALGAAAGAGGCLYLQKKADEERRREIASLAVEASEAERADELEKLAGLLEKAAALGDERARADAQRARRTLAGRREAERLVKQARELSEADKLEEAHASVKKATVLDSSSNEAREPLASVGKEIARRKAEAEKRAQGEALLKEAASLCEAGILEKGREKLAEALATIPDHTEARRVMERCPAQRSHGTTVASRYGQLRFEKAILTLKTTSENDDDTV